MTIDNLCIAGVTTRSIVVDETRHLSKYVKQFFTISISAFTYDPQQFHTVVAVAARRTEFSGEPRLANAVKYLFSSYATRSCQQRNRMRIHLKANALTAAWWSWPRSRCCW